MLIILFLFYTDTDYQSNNEDHIAMPNHYQSLILNLTQQPTEQEWLEFTHNFHSPEDIGKRLSAIANGACLAGKKFG